MKTTKAERGTPLDEIRAFDELREETLTSMQQELAARIARQPAPTAEERELGTYYEAIEPQVREAVRQLRAKGYATSASGFFGQDITWRIVGIEGEDVPQGTYAPTINPINRRAQIIDFSIGFQLDNLTLQKLHEAGAEAIQLNGLIYRIGFMPPIRTLMPSGNNGIRSQQSCRKRTNLHPQAKPLEFTPTIRI